MVTYKESGMMICRMITNVQNVRKPSNAGWVSLNLKEEKRLALQTNVNIRKHCTLFMV